MRAFLKQPAEFLTPDTEDRGRTLAEGGQRENVGRHQGGPAENPPLADGTDDGPRGQIRRCARPLNQKVYYKLYRDVELYR